MNGLVLKDTDRVISDVKVVADRVVFVEQDGTWTIAAKIAAKQTQPNVAIVPEKPKSKAGRKSNAERARLAAAESGKQVINGQAHAEAA